MRRLPLRLFFLPLTRRQSVLSLARAGCHAEKMQDHPLCVLGLSTSIVLNEPKQASTLRSGNQPLLDLVAPGDVAVGMRRADKAGVDVMWAFVKRNKEPR